MRTLAALAILAILTAVPVLAADPPPAATTATGIVFNDANRNGVRDPGEQGLPDIRVSNGRDIVRTGRDGTYRVPVDDDTILFVIKPRGWMTPTTDLNLPRFYYIHKPAGSPDLKYGGVAPTGPLPASVDFALHERPEPDQFKVLLLGDPQVTSIEQVQYLAHDVVAPLAGTDAAFGMALGDLMNNRLDVFEPLNRVLAHVGVPFYNVQGNHDMDYRSPDDQHADDVFERFYGPSYYSFDYGPVHFIVLDDVVWRGQDEKKGDDYFSGLGEKQLEFVLNDLRLLPADQLVVLTMHIPIIEVQERGKLFEALATHPHTVSFSAHYHYQQHWFIGRDAGWPGAEPHHHATLATTCGSWWHGALDEVGLPHTTMRDGGPNGWTEATFDGHNYKTLFRPARRPADYQMSVYAPEAVKSADVASTEVLVNVFAGSERSAVEMRIAGGDWIKLELTQREDPFYAATAAREAEDPPAAPARKVPKPIKCKHIWRGTLPAVPAAGVHAIDVRTTDMFGQTFTARRLIRVE